MVKMDKRKQTNVQEIPKDIKNDYNPSLAKRILLFGIPLAGIFIIFFIWTERYVPVVIDDWYRGINLVDSAGKASNPAVKKNLMDQGGFILKRQVTLHPYHARVWFLYGHYFLVNNKWDSCIYAEKKAIEIGAGGLVNNVEFIAAEQLNYAVEMKLRGIHNLDSSRKVISNAFTPNFENTTLDKITGFMYFNHNQNDSSIFYLERFNSKVKNDFDALHLLAWSYYRKGMKDKAIYFATEARKIKKDNPDVNKLLAALNAR